MKHKSQTRSILQSFLILVKTQLQLKVKCLLTDNGPEFRMSESFSSHGIIHQHSSVETLQQNAIVEHKHQHLLNVARSLRFQAHLPLSFWGECVLTTAHIINRLPTPLLPNKSPFELLFHKSTSYSHLQVFGCLCYASTLTRYRHKFDLKAKPCLFLSYPFDIKGIHYLIFLPNLCSFPEMLFSMKTFFLMLPNLSILLQLVTLFFHYLLLISPIHSFRTQLSFPPLLLLLSLSLPHLHLFPFLVVLHGLVVHLITYKIFIAR
jgi:hypothetical protein